jgi:hypothetical protein
MFVKTVQVPNGDHFEDSHYYRCDGCDASIHESHPHYEKSNDVHFCGGCAFMLRLVSPKWYATFCCGYRQDDLTIGFSFDGSLEWRKIKKVRVSEALKKPGLSKAKRFAILERDRFRCRYCGVEPDVATLQVDHVMPRSHGGSDDQKNLVTACSDCNIGKLDRLLKAER